MMKRLTYCVSSFAVGLLVAGVTMVEVEVRQAAFNHPNPSAVEFPTKILKKNELFTQGKGLDVIDVEQVWAAYGFYIDSGNGDGAASLYTEDAILRHFWSDKGAKFEQHGGAGTFQTPYGMTRGGGCVLRGREEIRKYFGSERPAAAWPGWTHHTSPNLMVKINDDGKTAVLTTTMLIASVNEKGDGRLTTGGYRVFFKKSPAEGWMIAEQYNFADRPRGNTRCDENGNLPRTAK